MSREPGPQHAQNQLVSLVSGFVARRLVWLAAAALLVAGAFVSSPAVTQAATADHLMCGWRAEARTQTVSIDPALSSAGITLTDVQAAFDAWNSLWRHYHGYDIFAVHYGNWWEADILVSANSSPTTWVAGQCTPSFAQRGNNHSVVFLGYRDGWRNRTMLAHEIGHALGFADHGSADASSGHVGYKPCYDYVGVMSYCTGPQSWFLDGDFGRLGFIVDGNLVRDYWR